MTERLSRFLVALEAIILAMPVTALAGFAGFAGFILLTNQPTPLYEQAQAIVYLVPIAPLIAGWILIVRFVLFGSEALRSSALGLWLTAFIGVAVFVLAALCAAAWVPVTSLVKPDSISYWLVSYLRELVFGLPALIPLAHLALERRLRAAPSTSQLERTQMPAHESTLSDTVWSVVSFALVFSFMLGSMFIAAAYVTPLVLGKANDAPRQGIEALVEPAVLFGGLVLGVVCALAVVGLIWRNFLPESTYDRWTGQFQAQATRMPWAVRALGGYLMKLSLPNSRRAL